MTARGNRLQLLLQDGALDASCTLIAQDCSDLNSEVRQNSFLLTGGQERPSMHAIMSDAAGNNISPAVHCTADGKHANRRLQSLRDKEAV